MILTIGSPSVSTLSPLPHLPPRLLQIGVKRDHHKFKARDLLAVPKDTPITDAGLRGNISVSLLCVLFVPCLSTLLYFSVLVEIPRMRKKIWGLESKRRA